MGLLYSNVILDGTVHSLAIGLPNCKPRVRGLSFSFCVFNCTLNWYGVFISVMTSYSSVCICEQFSSILLFALHLDPSGICLKLYGFCRGSWMNGRTWRWLTQFLTLSTPILHPVTATLMDLLCWSKPHLMLILALSEHQFIGHCSLVIIVLVIYLFCSRGPLFTRLSAISFCQNQHLDCYQILIG